jgi:ubiquinol oxidase
MRSSSVFVAAVAVAVASLLPSSALAFVSPAPSPAASPHPPTMRQLAPTMRTASTSNTALPSSGTTKEEEKSSSPANGGDAAGEWTIGAPSSRRILEARRKREVARNALGKLLERQQRDMRQTLDLLIGIDAVDDDYLFEIGGEGMEGGGGKHRRRNRDDDDVDGANPSSSSSSSSLDDGDEDDDDDDDDGRAIRSSIMASIAASVASGVDYGYTSRSEGCKSEPIKSNYLDDDDDVRFEGYGPPGNVLSLGSRQFVRNLRAMIGEYNDEASDGVALSNAQIDLQRRLRDLTLNSTAIWERERKRGPKVAPYVIKVPYYALCYLLDVVFEGRYVFGRFFLLETVARMPYFSYITMLHLYETLGFWRRSADVKRIHFAEEWNEYHHLLIMESLGGDQPYWVRFLAQHSALAYYVALCGLWLLSPSLSYKFSEMLETHAVDTYGQFVDENEAELRKLPPTLVAVEYYTIGLSDPMFGEYQTASVMDPTRRGDGVRKSGTDLRSLYDVFVAIRNDEGDHVHTMTSCLDPKVAVLSPALESRVLTGMALAAGASLLFGGTGFGGLGGVDGVGLNGIEGLEGLADMADGVTDLDSILSEDGSLGAVNAIAGGMAGFANGLKVSFYFSRPCFRADLRWNARLMSDYPLFSVGILWRKCRS